MGYFSNKVLDIVERSYDGDSAETIAKSLGMDVAEVVYILNEYSEGEYDSDLVLE